MLRIECPWCGLRDQDEFRYGGAAGVERPTDPAAVSDADWAAYLFYRDNPKGRHRERWLHAYGCRQWFTIERDVVTHAFVPGSTSGPGRGGSQ